MTDELLSVAALRKPCSLMPAAEAPYYAEQDVTLYHGDASCLPVSDESAQCCVTSPPYWGLRDYGNAPSVWGGDPACAHEWGQQFVNHKGGPQGKGGERSNRDTTAQDAAKCTSAGQYCRCGAWRGCFGLEPTPAMYVEHAVEIFREVQRVLKPDGVVWLNLGDSYCANKNGNTPETLGKSTLTTRADGTRKRDVAATGRIGRSALPGQENADLADAPHRGRIDGYKPKDLIGIPWRVALALQADGWYLRADIIWAKPNPMPESVTDRPTKSHEYIFLLAKSERYYYDADVIAEESVDSESHEGRRDSGYASRFLETGQDLARTRAGFGNIPAGKLYPTRNARSVWTIATTPYPGAHFATFPQALPERYILASSRPGDLVIDPFNGSGTTGEVCRKWGRRYVGIDLNTEYLELSKQRFRQGVLFGASA